MAIRTSQPGGWITDVDGVKVGHFTDSRRPTGCSVVLCEMGAVTGVDVRGSAPGTRETDLLDPVNTIDRTHAILLAGGSAFGLDAATGVVRYLEERGFGFPTQAVKVPIVPAAILYDLTLGDPSIRPNADAGYAACANARRGPVAEGSVGAGAGATVGKLATGRRMKGGIGTSSIRLSNGLVVGAIVAVNCVGNVIDPKTGRTLAGLLGEENRFTNIIEILSSGEDISVIQQGTNTTIGVVATNAELTKSQITKVAQMAQDGLARCINPVHTTLDGDTLFAISTATCKLRADVTVIGALSAEAVSEAVLRGVMRAKSSTDILAYEDLSKNEEQET